MKIKTLFGIVYLMSFSSCNAQEKITIPPYLQKGDTIAIVAPAGILKNRKAVILKAKNLANSWGLHVILGKNIFNQAYHFAGTDEERAKDFQEALDNPNIKAIWAARGGYGSVRILDKLDFTKFLKHPKWIVGYSDITAFHNHIHNLRVETIHGMMATSLEENPEKIAKTIASCKKALFGEQLVYKIPSSEKNRLLKNGISGEIIGGNISILSSMLGSESQINTDGKILFIEEIGEYKYSIDRMLQSLKRAGYFKNLKAVIVGNMSKVKKNSTPWGSSVEQLILATVPKQIPVLFDFPAGHEANNWALIFGRKVTLNLDSSSKKISLMF